MCQPNNDLLTLREQQYDLRQQLNRLHRELSRPESAAALQELVTAQEALYKVEHEIAANTQPKRRETQVGTAPPSRPTGTTRGALMAAGGGTRGTATTGLEVTVNLQMAQVPTAYYHLLDPETDSLIECIIKTVSANTRCLRIISFIEGYTAQAVSTIELDKEQSHTIRHLPTFFPDKTTRVRELTRATINVLAEDLQTHQIEVHMTVPVWLLARNSAPLAIRNASTNVWNNDLSRYLGAFVTPHQEDVMAFLSEAAQCHPQGKLYGYQDGASVAQVRAVYEALSKADITYVNSALDFTPEEGASTQRVRLPRETLRQKQANCLDATLLFASLLEAITLNPAIVIVPKHALVGWQIEPGEDRLGNWQFLETSYIKEYGFDDAVKTGTMKARAYEALQAKANENEATKNELWFRHWSLRQLRTQYGITPME
jgi:hypothetical protein